MHSFLGCRLRDPTCLDRFGAKVSKFETEPRPALTSVVLDLTSSLAMPWSTQRHSGQFKTEPPSKVETRNKHCHAAMVVHSLRSSNPVRMQCRERFRAHTVQSLLDYRFASELEQLERALAGRLESGLMVRLEQTGPSIS